METMCQANPRDNTLATNRHNASKDLNDLLAMEESYWKQWSRVSWLKEGDRNTRFFHASASQCKQKNEIKSLQDCHGNLVTRRDNMVQVVEDYFRGIYHTSSLSIIDQVVQLVETKVTTDMNNTLLLPFIGEEVRTALFQMNPSKALGPDGMNAFFYQKFWHIVGNDVTTAVLDFLNSGQLLKSINYTHISLIPKIKSSDHMT